MPPKTRATSAQPPQEEEDDLNLEHRIEERMQCLMQQQQEDTRKEQQAMQQVMMKQMEELITNRFSPLASPALVTPPPSDPSAQKETPPPPPASRTYERTPTIPSIDKLKGRSNYKTWTINIKLHARNLHIWSAIQGQSASEEQEDLAQSLIGLNIITVIQHQIEGFTAAKAWTYLEQRYNTRNISQITKTVQELCHINYDKFNSIESFQQRLLTLKRQITEFTTSSEEAFHVMMAAFTLNGIGRADSTIKGQIENSLNSEKLKYNDELEQHIFDKLFAFRNPHGSKSNINAVNKPADSNKDCKICKKPHRSGTCWVENPEKAPKGKQEHYRKLKDKLLSEKAEKEASTDLGFISSIDQPDTNDLCLDSGSPCHIIKDRHLFIKLQPFHRKFSVTNSTPLEAQGISKIQIHSPKEVNISNAYYCPKATQNLISMEQIFERGMEIRPHGKKPYKQADLLINSKHVFNMELKRATIRIITQPKSISGITTRQAAAQQPAA